MPIPEPVPGMFVAGDCTLPGMAFVMGLVNDRLGGKSGRTQVAPCVVFEDGDRRPVLVIRPGNLLAAMWLQLADTVTGKRRQRACGYCGEFFEVKRERGVYCGDRCRVAENRRRNKEC